MLAACSQSPALIVKEPERRAPAVLVWLRFNQPAANMQEKH